MMRTRSTDSYNSHLWIKVREEKQDNKIELVFLEIIVIRGDLGLNITTIIAHWLVDRQPIIKNNIKVNDQ